jgi:WD40 repeat protein
MHFVRLCLAVCMLLAIACSSTVRAQDAAWIGAAFETVTPEIAAKRALTVPFGARITAIAPGGPAERAGLAAGDVVFSLGGKPLVSAAELDTAIAGLEPGANVDLVRARSKQPPAGVAVKLVQRPGSQAELAATQMMLDTGGHMSIVRGVAFTPDGKQIVSASEDKTIRVWDLASGKTVRFIRGEAASGILGKIYTMALSPDGKWLATAGVLHVGKAPARPSIRLYDFASGKLVATLEGHDGSVFNMAFSPDGNYLISGGEDFTAIVWDMSTLTPKKRLVGHAGHLYGLAFTPDSTRAITSSFDGTLKLWSIEDGSDTALATMTGHRGKIRCLAVAPDGRIASGDRSGEIRIWDGTTGAPLGTITRENTVIGSIAFSPDGKRLLASVASRTAPYTVRVYDLVGGADPLEYSGHSNIVVASTISRDGRWAATGGGSSHEVHVWELATGKPRQGADGRPLYLVGAGHPAWAASVSQDGRQIAWGKEWGSGATHTSQARSPLQFALELPAEGQALGRPFALTPADAARFLRAERQRGGMSLRHYTGGRFGLDATLKLLQGERELFSVTRNTGDGIQHRAYSFTPDAKAVISGGDGGHLEVFDLGGDKTGTFIGHRADILSVTPSADGRFLVSGSVDQTVRLWNLKSHELIVTLFHGSDGEWVMWTPQGYYTGSPNGGELVGWQVSQGADNAARYVRGRQLRDKLLRPDIVARAIVLASAEAAVMEAGLAGVSVETLLTQTPPTVLARAWETKVAGGRGLVMVATEKNPLPVLETKITVSDGKQETVVRPRVKPLPGGTPQPDPDTTLRSYEVPLFKGENTVRIVSVNAAGESEPKEVTITNKGEGVLDKRGTLWVLAIGADRYPGAKRMIDPETGKAFVFRDLKYAGADATAFAQTAVAEMKPSHTSTDVTVLVNGGGDGEPTRANILAALERIRTASADTDTVLVFLAGHGENWAGGRYHYLPTDFTRTATDALGDNLIDWKEDIHPAITGAKGRKVLFLDACYSANAYNTTLGASALADRFVAFAAAGAEQTAKEFTAQGHGAFTYALLEGLKGAPEALDPLENGVTVIRLAAFVETEVRKQTDHKQKPEFSSGQGNFVLTRK